MMTRFTTLILLLPMLLIGSYATAEEKYEDELHYFSVIPEQPGGEGDRVNVVEFFWYGCPHCYQLEPSLNAWLARKPENVDYVAIPATFSRLNDQNKLVARPDLELHAKTYYALKLMGESDRLHDVIFETINEKRRKLATQDDMESFLEDQGVDVAAYRKMMKSFAVKSQFNRAMVLEKRFNVQGVPAIIVDGKYRTGGFGGETLMDITDFLIDKTRAEK
ncbi:MAG: thiol:disulfide interchange protein DsbA/DsbL [Gammaproteobacteria bacterium]|nr:thiol:disulfide interchange protein DsbA/DsbL [Gammaproteobacteria bacterium]